LKLTPPPPEVPPKQPTARTATEVTALLARRRTRRRLIAIAALVIVIGGLAAWYFTHGPAPVHYTTAPVTRGDIVRGVTASGTVNPQTTVQVGSYVSGSIEQVLCDYNTQVKKGQLCAKIDSRPYESTLDQERANVAAAEAQLAKDRSNLSLQQANFNRAKALYDQQLLSRDQFDLANANYQQAQSQIQVDQSALTQRNAALKSAQVNLGYTNIVSPVDGTVVSRNVTVGQTVAASFQTPTLFLIATDLTKMQVDASVSEGDIGGIKESAPVTFTVEAFPGKRFQGSVTQVRQAPEAVQNVVTYDAVVTVSNPELLLKPGMTANVRIVVDKRENVLRVPDQALRFSPSGPGSASTATQASRPPGLFGIGGLVGRGGGRRGGGGRGAAEAPVNQSGSEGTVYVLRDGAPVAVPVTLGLDDDTNSEILSSDLAEGDQVIVSEGK